jgi:hypothetical protein
MIGTSSHICEDSFGSCNWPLFSSVGKKQGRSAKTGAGLSSILTAARQ